MAGFSNNPLSENYWRVLSRRVTWLQAWFAMRRLRKDSRARAYLAGLAGQLAMAPLALLGFLVCAALIILVVSAGSEAGASPIFAFLGLLIGFSVRGFRRFARSEATPAEMPQPLSPDQLRATHAFFSDLALIFAILAYRANSEAFLKKKVLPGHIQIVSRQRHMELIRSRDLWEKLLPGEKQILMMPDGEWSWPLIHEASLMQEQLRLTRWILRLDYFLPDLGSQWQFEPRCYKELMQTSGKPAGDPRLIRSQNLDVAEKTAGELHRRCIAEEIHRGLLPDAPDEVRLWASGVCERLGSNQSDDFLVGDTIISDLPEQSLRYISELAARRQQFLAWTQKILNAEEPPTRESTEFAT